MTQAVNKKDSLKISVNNEVAGKHPVAVATYREKEYDLSQRSERVSLTNALLSPLYLAKRDWDDICDKGKITIAQRHHIGYTQDELIVDFGELQISCDSILDGTVKNPVKEINRRVALCKQAFIDKFPKVEMTFTEEDVPENKWYEFTYRKVFVRLELNPQDNTLLKGIIHDKNGSEPAFETNFRHIYSFPEFKRKLVEKVTGFTYIEQKFNGIFTRGETTYTQMNPKPGTSAVQFTHSISRDIVSNIDIVFLSHVNENTWEATVAELTRRLAEIRDLCETYTSDTDVFFAALDGNVIEARLRKDAKNEMWDFWVNGKLVNIYTETLHCVRKALLLTALFNRLSDKRIQVWDLYKTNCKVNIDEVLTMTVRFQNNTSSSLSQVNRSNMPEFLSGLLKLARVIRTELNNATNLIVRPFDPDYMDDIVTKSVVVGKERKYFHFYFDSISHLLRQVVVGENKYGGYSNHSFFLLQKELMPGVAFTNRGVFSDQVEAYEHTLSTDIHRNLSTMHSNCHRFDTELLQHKIKTDNVDSFWIDLISRTSEVMAN